MSVGFYGFDWWTELLQSEAAAAARQRVLRQLMESMIHEELTEMSPAESFGYSREASGTREQEWAVAGLTRDGTRVLYVFLARRTVGFGRIRIVSPIRRKIEMENTGEWREARMPSPMAGVLEELAWRDPEASLERLVSFAKELEHTVANDAFHAWHGLPGDNQSEPDSLTAGEAQMSFAHPYHPCYKSRIGFTLQDHLDYAPEFKPQFGLEWLAIHRDLLEICVMSDLNYDEYMAGIIGRKQIERFRTLLRQSGVTPAEYAYLPVHPWQWKNKLATELAPLIAEKAILALGEDEERYQPLQSIRTLANVSNPFKPYVKTAMSLFNTSALRIIGSHHIRNAPAVSEWLDGIRRRDEYLQDECRVIVLRETAGAALRYDRLPRPLESLLNGAAAAVFRESIEPMLEQGERAVPYTYLTHKFQDGTPAVQRWIERYGVQQWLNRLLEVTMAPQLHLFYAYGIGLESHGQNMVLIHRDGWPERIALRDLPGGIRCLDDQAGVFANRPELPVFDIRPGDTHPILTDSPAEVRDFWLDGFMHIQLHELSLLMTEAFGIEERAFWDGVADQELAYCARFPQWKERYALFDLGAPQVCVGQLTARKIRGEGADREHVVENPLSSRIQRGEYPTVFAPSAEGRAAE